MQLLLDTHLLVWAMGSPERLPAGLATMLEDPLNTPVRGLSGKKSARGADLSTSQSLLRVEHYELRDRQMAVIESWPEAEG